MDSSSQAARTLSTLIIWAAVTILGIGALVNATFLDSGAVVVIMILLVVGAAGATQAVWRSPAASSQMEAEKAKRRGKVDRMLDRLSEDEIEDLRARLMAESDGEQVSLEELLEARGRGSR